MNLIREYVKTILAEKAISAQDISSGEISLCISKQNNFIILYRTEMISKLIEDENPKLDYFSVSKIIQPNIVGTIQIRKPQEGDYPCNGAGEISTSAAEKGFGPLLYDIAMAAMPNHTLMPDRGKKTEIGGGVSSAARKVWNYYLTNRKDVKAKPLDNADDPKTPDKSDDCLLHGDYKQNAVDYSFTASWDMSKYSSLVQQHNSNMKNLEKNLGTSRGEFEHNLIDAAESFFGEKYVEGK